jgi:8-oxo-dGTP diphosphatase
MSSRKSTLVAVGVLEHQGKLCLIQFKRNVLAGYWGLPGGKIDIGESLPEAVVREFKEETGLDVEFNEFLALLDEEITSKKGVDYFVMIVCRVRLTSSTQLKRIENDEGVVDWFTPEEIIDKTIPTVPSDYEILTKVALGNLRGYIFSQMDLTTNPPSLNRFDFNS